MTIKMAQHEVLDPPSTVSINLTKGFSFQLRYFGSLYIFLYRQDHLWFDKLFSVAKYIIIAKILNLLAWNCVYLGVYGPRLRVYVRNAFIDVGVLS